MNRDDIIRMAEEAGFQVDRSLLQFQPNCISWGIYTCHPQLERFAALVVQECIDVLSDNEICSNHVSHALRVHFALSEKTPQFSDKTEQRIKQQTPDYLEKCPNCGGPADSWFDRSWFDQNPYCCNKCMKAMEY